MEKYTFTVETDDREVIRDLQNAPINSAILYELKHNFWRKWKHSDAEGDYRKGIDEVLNALETELNTKYEQ